MQEKHAATILPLMPAAANKPAPQATPVSQPRRLVFNGYLDECSGGFIRGWAANLTRPHEPVMLDIVIDGRLCKRVAADEFRIDLKENKIGTGFHAFCTPLPAWVFDGKEHLLSIRITNTNFELHGVPVKLRENPDMARIYVSEIQNIAAQLKNQTAQLTLNTTLQTTMRHFEGLSKQAGAYRLWIEKYDTLTDPDRVYILRRIQELSKPPLISILMPVYNPPLTFLEQAIDSVRNQLYQKWELCIADDGSTDPQVKHILERYAALDRRIKITFREQNGHISEATNSALRLAKGEYITFLDQDDLLPEHALYHVAVKICQDSPDILYSDEDKVDENGVRFEPHFKPDFNYDLLLSYNYVCHLTVFRARLMEKVGLFNSYYNGSQDHEYLLRAIERLTDNHKICHIPKVLYHWRAHSRSTANNGEAKSYASEAGLKAVRDHLSRIKAKAEASLNPDRTYKVQWKLPAAKPKVSVIIPTRDCAPVLSRCIATLLQRTDYPNFEIIIIDNQSKEPETLALFKELSRAKKVRVYTYDDVFNFSAIINFGVSKAKGELLCLLNNDMEIVEEKWLGEMVAHALREDVGAVGAKLLYPDGRVQHGGVILGLGGVAGHSHKYFPQDDPGYFRRLTVTQELTAVTAACMVLRRELFEKVGGFDAENLPVSFNDVDFCLKIHREGFRNIWTPHALLVHHESISRGPEDTPAKLARASSEIHYIKAAWNGILKADPHYNPNLTLNTEDFAIGV